MWHAWDMALIQPVSNAIAIFAGMLSLGLGTAFVAVAVARISVDFFKGWCVDPPAISRTARTTMERVRTTRFMVPCISHGWIDRCVFDVVRRGVLHRVVERWRRIRAMNQFQKKGVNDVSFPRLHQPVSYLDNWCALLVREKSIPLLVLLEFPLFQWLLV